VQREQFTEELATVLIILDDKDRLSGHRFVEAAISVHCGVNIHLVGWKTKREYCTLARLALNVNVSPHATCHLLCNPQTQSEAAESLRRLQTYETLEDLLDSESITPRENRGRAHRHCRSDHLRSGAESCGTLPHDSTDIHRADVEFQAPLTQASNIQQSVDKRGKAVDLAVKAAERTARDVTSLTTHGECKTQRVHRRPQFVRRD
jgi:hypothetical protein